MAAAKMNLPVIEKGATYRQVDLSISATDTSTLDGLGKDERVICSFNHDPEEGVVALQKAADSAMETHD